jgi:hypothetical protein
MLNWRGTLIRRAYWHSASIIAVQLSGIDLRREWRNCARMKAFQTIVAGIFAVVGMGCFVGTFMQFQKSPSEAGALFLAFAFCAWMATCISPAQR